MEDFVYKKLLIRVNDNSDHDLIDRIARDLKDATGLTAGLTYEESKATSEVTTVIDMIFMGAIAIMMFLCFFALSASMTANLYDQVKEIGVLRSMGFTKIRITQLYFYEASILVFASSFLGILIGLVVGWSFKL